MMKKPPFSRIRDEIRKINWHEVNRQTQRDFLIALAGPPETTAAMRSWLRSCDYRLAGFAPVPPRPRIHERRMLQRLVGIPCEPAVDVRLLRAVSFGLCTPECADMVRSEGMRAYVFDPDPAAGLPHTILVNNREIAFALSHTFPVFRPAHAGIEIRETALQNAAWAMGSALPNVVPGLHQIFTAPLEGFSDFVVLTTNEVKLMFELAGLAGYRVNPARLLVETGIVLALAKTAQMAATQITGKVPAGAGLAVKGGVAYAFTYAIGEAVFFYLLTGQQVTKDFLKARAKFYLKEGVNAAKEMLLRRRG